MGDILPRHGGLNLPPHGGDLDWARRQFGGFTGEWLDLSTGINPIPYPIAPLAAPIWTRLPTDSAVVNLMAAAVDYYGIAAENIVPSAGSQSLIQIIPELVTCAHKTVDIIAPTYGEHALAWHRADYLVKEIDGLAKHIPEPAAPFRIVVHPNNPTGLVYDTAQLRSWAATCAAMGGFLLVDEAFADIAPCQSVMAGNKAGEKFPEGVIVIKSFGKFFGLAGVRLGFLCASVPMIEKARERLGPWAVSGPALAIGAAALSDHTWITTTRQRLATESAKMRGFLVDHHFRLVGHTDLFTLVSHKDAMQIFRAFAEKGILLRGFAPSLHPDAARWLRIGLPAHPDGFFDRAGKILKNLGI